MNKLLITLILGLSSLTNYAQSNAASASSSCNRPYADIDCAINEGVQEVSSFYPGFHPFDTQVEALGFTPVSDNSISLPFSFSLYGSIYNEVYVNRYGNLSFGRDNSYYDVFEATEYYPGDLSQGNTYGKLSDVGFPIIAPFWADNDGADIYYKLESAKLTVLYLTIDEDFEPYAMNTFEVIITDGNDDCIGKGNNVAFVYYDIQHNEGPNYNENYISLWDDDDAPGVAGITNGKTGEVCAEFTLGYFNKEGKADNGCRFFYNETTNEYEGLSGIDFLDNKTFVFDVSSSPSSDASLAISTDQLFCATTFQSSLEGTDGCNIQSYTWDFGDGNTSSEANPAHAYATDGNYDVSLTVDYQCGSCPNSVSASQSVSVATAEPTFSTQNISILTDSISQVLSASATTFSDAWPINHPTASLNDRHSFLNGAQGVWRAQENFVYDIPRTSSPAINTAQDGTFTLEKFNWQQAPLRAIPDWLPANEVTEYSPYGYELENRDVLGRHSAALYSYEGQLPHAIGTNMRHDEMAYTGFEYIDNQRDGNWRLGTNATPAYQRYPVEIGLRHVVLVRTPLATLEDVETVDVVAYSPFVPSFIRRNRYVNRSPILCQYAHKDNPDWTVLVLKRSIMEIPWMGAVIVRGAHAPGIIPSLDNNWAHSGQKSLKITSDLTLPQELLSLDSGRQYLISVWVSVKNLQLPEPKLADGIGLRLVGKNEDDDTTLDQSFAPGGPIVEGWQQLTGLFVYPGQGSKLSLTFQKGSAATAWFDDLRLHPTEGNMQAYVYNPETFRLQATLDENGYATLYYYDQEGNLYLTKKETERGIQTIQEAIDYQAITNP